MLLKLLVCLQAFWFAVQVAPRLANALPDTLLEYHVVIHVCYAMAMYFFWWLKPKDVNEPIQVLRRSVIPDAAFSAYVKMVPQSKHYILDEILDRGFGGQTDALMVAVLGLPTAFLHLLAWNTHSHSTPEKWIWRVCSIGIGVAPLIIYTHFVFSKYIVSSIQFTSVRTRS